MIDEERKHNDELNAALQIINRNPAEDLNVLTEAELFPDSITGDELMKKEFAPLYQPVDGLITEGYALLVGGSKIGKSWLMLDLAYSVANGTPFLGRSTKKSPVLYFALEDSERRVQDRNVKMGLLSGCSNIRYVFKAQTIDEDFCGTTDAWLTMNGGRCLVIVDVLQKIRGRTRRSDGDSYQTDYRTTNPLLDLARKHHAAIVCVHHTNKDSSGRDVYAKISGSTGLMGAADTVIMIERERGNSTAEVNITGREIREASFEIRMDDNMRWHAITPEAAARERYEANPVVQPIRDLFKEYPNGGRISYGDFTVRCLGRFPYRDSKAFVRALNNGLAAELLQFDKIVIDTGKQTGQGSNHAKGFEFSKAFV